jgi:Tfp pilus assembly protein PilO
VVSLSSALAAALIVYTAYAAFDSPGRDTSRNRIRRLKAEIADTLMAVQEVKAARQRLDAFTAECERLKLDLATLAKILPATIVPETEVATLEELAATLGLTARGFKIAPRRNLEFYSATEVSFFLEGATAEQIDQLVESINTRKPIKKVVELEVSTSRNLAWITVDLYEDRAPSSAGARAR